MKFKGKIAVWFWAMFILLNALLLYALIFLKGGITLIIVLAIFNLVFLPILIRNYVLLDKGVLTVYFGLGKDSINVNSVTEVYRTHNVIASSAASLDRIVIKGAKKELICAVNEKEKLYAEMGKINPQINFRK